MIDYDRIFRYLEYLGSPRVVLIGGVIPDLRQPWVTAYSSVHLYKARCNHSLGGGFSCFISGTFCLTHAPYANSDYGTGNDPSLQLTIQ